MIAGLNQAMQNSTTPQTLSNKLRLMVQELKMGSETTSRTDVLDIVYTKSGATQNLDGSRVCLRGMDGIYKKRTKSKKHQNLFCIS